MTELSTIEQSREKNFLLPGILISNSETPVTCPIDFLIIMGSSISSIKSETHELTMEISQKVAKVTTMGNSQKDLVLKIETEKTVHVYVEV